MYRLPDNLSEIADQPVERIEEVCGIYFRSILLAEAGHYVPQHVHDHDHATFVGSGKVRLWVDDEFQADFEAGRAIEVKAGRRHVFQALEPMTRLACVHDIQSAESVKAKGV